MAHRNTFDSSHGGPYVLYGQRDESVITGAYGTAIRGLTSGSRSLDRGVVENRERSLKRSFHHFVFAIVALTNLQ